MVQNQSKKIITYSEDKLIGGNYTFNAGDKLYIKNILVSEARLKIPFVADGLHLKKAVFNIMNKNFVPNVSRNNFSETLKQDLSYAIGKALHLWILEHGNISTEEKELIRSFIKECYPKDNYCLKPIEAIILYCPFGLILRFFKQQKIFQSTFPSNVLFLLFNNL